MMPAGLRAAGVGAAARAGASGCTTGVGVAVGAAHTGHAAQAAQGAHTGDGPCTTRTTGSRIADHAMACAMPTITLALARKIDAITAGERHGEASGVGSE